MLNKEYYIVMQNKDEKILFTTTEVAKFLKISRISVFQRIKNGSIKAKKYGRIYLVPREQIEDFIVDNKKISDAGKIEIKNAVERAIKEYGEAIRLLGKE